jgi:two-component system chemotaxis sensor kinase CheA
MDELLRTFVEESREALALLAQDVAALVGGEPAALRQARRLLHTLKGSAGFLDQPVLEALAHTAEDLLAAGGVGAAALRDLFSRIADEVAAIEGRAPPPFEAAPAEVPVAQGYAGIAPALAALGAALGKDIALVLSDDGSRIDSALAQTLRTVLLHLVRNAAVHGIEPPAERRAAGKSAAGTIVVAFHCENGVLRVHVRDDGRGLDLGALARAAERAGAADAAVLATMTAEERAALVWRPGVSTATAVTMLAGRGVGLDAVREVVTARGGKVAVSTAPGQGTSFDLTLPLGGTRAPAAPRAA